MFTIELSEIRANAGQPYDVEFEEQIEALDFQGAQVTFDGPLKVKTTIVFIPGVLWVEGTAAGRCVLQCSRCLKDFSHEINVRFREKFRQEGDILKGDDAEIALLPGDIVDLGTLIADSVLLSLPMKAVCHDDCQGLCPRCGQNLNEGVCECPSEDIDPRLAELAKLLN